MAEILTVDAREKAFWIWLESRISWKNYKEIRRIADDTKFYYCMQYGCESSIFSAIEESSAQHIYEKVSYDSIFEESYSLDELGLQAALFDNIRSFLKERSFCKNRQEIVFGNLSSSDFSFSSEDIEKGFLNYLDDNIPWATRYICSFIYEKNYLVKKDRIFSPDTSVTHEEIQYLRAAKDYNKTSSQDGMLKIKLIDYLEEFYNRPKESIIRDVRIALVKEQGTENIVTIDHPKKNKVLDQFILFLIKNKSSCDIKDPFIEIRKPLETLAYIWSRTINEIFLDDLTESFSIEKKMRMSASEIGFKKQTYLKAMDYYHDFLTFRETQKYAGANGKERISFDKSENVLYICKGTISCERKNHDIISATGILASMSGDPVSIDVNYCTVCKIYFIDQDTYQDYRNQFGILMGNFSFQNDNTPTGEESEGWAEKSILNICGYTVGMEADLDERERWFILENIMVRNILPKYKIEKFLKFLIRFHKKNKNNQIAVRKWKADLNWVRNFNIDQQRHFWINEIKKARKP